MSHMSVYRALPLFSLDLLFTTTALVATLHPNIISLPFLSIQTHHDQPNTKPLVFTPPLHALLTTLALQRLVCALTGLSVPPALSPTSTQRKRSIFKGSPFLNRAKATADATVLALLFAVALHVLVVLFGASVFDNAISTAWLSLYVAFLAVFPAAYRLGPNPQVWTRIFIEQSPQEDTLEALIHLPTTLSLVGTWLGAVVIPLDWERPWQTWPLPCIYGTFAGYFIGSILALVKISLQNPQIASPLPGPSSPVTKPRIQKKSQ